MNSGRTGRTPELAHDDPRVRPQTLPMLTKRHRLNDPSHLVLRPLDAGVPIHWRLNFGFMLLRLEDNE
jgi:hypothetical protein